MGRAGRGFLSLVMLVAALGGCFASLTADAPAPEGLADVSVAAPRERPAAPTVAESAEVDDANEDGDDALDEAAELPDALALVSSDRKPAAATRPGRWRSRVPSGRLFRPPRAS